MEYAVTAAAVASAVAFAGWRVYVTLRGGRESGCAKCPANRQ